MTIIKNFETSKERRLPKKIILATLSLILLVIVEVWVYNNTAQFGHKFDSISKTKANLSLENQILENEIAKYASLTGIASQSAMLGFRKPSVIQYLR